MDTISISHLYFKQEIAPNEIIMFRGAINKLLFAEPENLLFHNHQSEGLRYAYPMVQYKCLNHHAVIVALGDAQNLLKKLAEQNELHVRLGKKSVTFDVMKFTVENYRVDIADHPKFYHVSRYIPFTEENYSEYKSLLALTDKVMMIEKMLVGNILSFLKGIGCHIDETLSVAVTDIQSTYFVKYKGIHFLAFDLSFVSNIELPSSIGLGKSTSVGFGPIVREGQ